ncbi:hypothetical protein BKA66DRAFT_475884 [Pyrenochaeta sp. MPI-SDFR-AT-0127]|nr:hypothetical protein BKA66DRAFT_475884 [Pyrenochaeta sp. MPI-SDFR-AT-0127]
MVVERFYARESQRSQRSFTTFASHCLCLDDQILRFRKSFVARITTMSMAFETAAGAFAVVGVADVVVRASREISTFIRDVADAPNQIKALQEHLQEVAVLAQACNHYVHKRNTVTHSLVPASLFSSLTTALKALNRELQGIKAHISKFKGPRKTWTRVKYVLDECRINKALSSLERSRTLLADTLVLVHVECSSSENQSIDLLLQECSEQIDMNADGLALLITTVSNNHHDLLASKLEDQHQQLLVRTEHVEQGLVTNQHQLATALQMQQHVRVGQNRLQQSSFRTQKQTVTISKKLNTAHTISTRNHKITRDMITNMSTQLDQLNVSNTKRSATFSQSGREIHFLGDRRDMIMAYLLPLQDYLRDAIDRILVQRIEGVSARHACWLEDQFKYLLGSAAQNEAARYSRSTATAFDQWFFHEIAIDSTRRSKKREATSASGATVLDELVVQKSITQSCRKRPKRSRQTLSFNTPAGILRMGFPYDKTSSRELQDSDEISLSFTAESSHLFSVTDVHFLHKMINAHQKRVCAQLNVFTLSPAPSHDCDLLKFGTVEDIDTALRDGIISPYHLCEQGHNLLLHNAIINARMDLLDHLDHQGIGISNLRSDDGAIVSVDLLYSNQAVRDKNTNFVDLFTFLLDKVADPLKFVSCWALMELTSGLKNRKYSEYALQFLMKLSSKGFDCAMATWPDCSDNGDGELDWQSTSTHIRFWLEISPDAAAINSRYMRWLQKWLQSGTCVHRCGEAISSEIMEEVLDVFIKAEVDLLGRDWENELPSMAARRRGWRSEWCQALAKNGKCIEEVLQREKNEWLARDDWQQTWNDLYPSNQLDCWESSHSTTPVQDDDLANPNSPAVKTDEEVSKTESDGELPPGEAGGEEQDELCRNDLTAQKHFWSVVL